MAYLLRLLGRLLASVVWLGLLLGLSCAGLRWWIDDAQIARFVEQTCQQQWDLSVALRQFQLHLVQGRLEGQLVWLHPRALGQTGTASSTSTFASSIDADAWKDTHPARLQSFHVHWRWSGLLRGMLHIEELALQGVVVHREVADGSDQAWQPWLGPQDGVAHPQHSDPNLKPTAPEVPLWPHLPKIELPLGIRVDRVMIHVERLDWQQGDGHFYMEGLTLLGGFQGRGQHLQSRWSLQLNKPSLQQPYNLRWQSPQQQLNIAQQMQLHLTMGGLDGLQWLWLWQGEGSLLQEGQPVQPLVWQSEQLLWLEPQSRRAVWQYGRLITSMGMEANLQQIGVQGQSDGFVMQFDQVAVKLELAKLSPLLAAWLPTWRSRGTLDVALQHGHLHYPVQPSILPSWQGFLRGEQLAIELQSPEPVAVLQTDVGAQWSLGTEFLTAKWQLHLGQARLAHWRLGGLVLHGHVHIPRSESSPEQAPSPIQAHLPERGGSQGQCVWQLQDVQREHQFQMRQFQGDIALQGPWMLGPFGLVQQALPWQWQGRWTWERLQVAPSKQVQIQWQHGKQTLKGSAFKPAAHWLITSFQHWQARHMCGLLEQQPTSCGAFHLGGELSAQIQGDGHLVALQVQDWQLGWGALLEGQTTCHMGFHGQEIGRWNDCRLQLGTPSLQTWQPLLEKFNLGVDKLAGQWLLQGQWSGPLQMLAVKADWQRLQAAWSHDPIHASQGSQDVRPSRGLGSPDEILEVVEDVLKGWQQQLVQGAPLLAELRLQVQGLQLHTPFLHAVDVSGQSLWQLASHHASWHQDWRWAKLHGANAPATDAGHLPPSFLALAWTLTPEQMAWVGQGEWVGVPGYPTTAQQAGAPLRWLLHMDYPWSGALHLGQLQVAFAGMDWTWTGYINQPLGILLQRRWLDPQWAGMDLDYKGRLRFENPSLPPALQGYQMKGLAYVDLHLRLSQGQLLLASTLGAEHVYVDTPWGQLLDMDGSFPMQWLLLPGRHPQGFVLPFTWPLGDGTMTLQLAQALQQPLALDYGRIKAYQRQPKLSLRKVVMGQHAWEYLMLTGRLEGAVLQLDEIAGHLLGGDVKGQLRLALQADRSLTGRLSVLISQLDASYFPALGLTPGQASELNADFALDIGLGPQRRLLDITMHITKIGRLALDRCLRLLDPEDRDAKLRRNRENLRFVTLEQVAVWSQYDQLNMDVHYQPLLRIPGTSIGYRPIDRALLRRYSLSDTLDHYLNPWLQTYLAPMLGW